MSARSHTVAPGPLAQHRQDTGATHTLGDLETELAHPCGDDAGSAVLLEPELRMRVQVPVQLLETAHAAGALRALPIQPRSVCWNASGCLRPYPRTWSTPTWNAHAMPMIPNHGMPNPAQSKSSTTAPA